MYISDTSMCNLCNFTKKQKAMNTKNFSVILACLFAGIFLLSSCHEDEEIDNPKDFSGWGYFEGTINGKKKLIENTVYNRFIGKMNCKSMVFGESSRIKGSCIGINNLSDKEEIITGVAIMLINPRIGIRHIVNNPTAYFYDYNYDGVIGRVITQEATCFFKPAPNKPVKVEITSMDYNENGAPRIIEGEIDGVVYFRQDSIEIKGKFGVR